jgi:lipoprotein Spr
MTSAGEPIAARARELLGTRFRFQGRGPDGVDCIGVAVHALGLRCEAAPRDYALRGGSLARLGAGLQAIGLQLCADEAAAPGDVLVLRPAPEQLHLAVATGTGFIHADAGLRRVVERPLPLPWPCLARWRAPQRGSL